MEDSDRVTLALAALAEVTDPANVGELIGASAPAPGVVDLRFATTQAGYPGWAWTVSTSAVDGVEPTVLEVELLPGDAALLAPPWVPWAERLAEWRRVHPAGTVPDPDLVGDDDDLDDDLDDELEEELDDDLDGVDDEDLDGVDVDVADEDEDEALVEDGLALEDDAEDDERGPDEPVLAR